MRKFKFNKASLFIKNQDGTWRKVADVVDNKLQFTPSTFNSDIGEFGGSEPQPRIPGLHDFKLTITKFNPLVVPPLDCDTDLN